jgi:hypothetical protein
MPRKKRPISATPPPTASSTSKAGTTSPAADTAICRRPPDILRESALPQITDNRCIAAKRRDGSGADV